jgi:uncharacterized protein (TIGR02271 family)
MYPNDDRTDRKKSRGRVRPPATGAATDASALDRPLAPATSHDMTMADPLSGYPAAGMAGEMPAPYPTAGAYAEPPAAGQAAGGYGGPAASYPTAGSFAEPSATQPTPGAYADFAASQQTFGSGTAFERGANAERTLELREEQLVARKDLREVGEITVRTVVEEVPGRLEVEAQREEVEIEHVPMGQIVTERVGPYEEDGVLVVPVYEEQLVVVKRLVLKEHLRVRRVANTERQLFEDTLRRDRLVIEDPNNTQLVHEQYATLDNERDGQGRATHDEGGPLGQLMRKLLG